MAKQKINSAQQLNTVQSYTSTGTGGGTGYYINIGGLKICWGFSGQFSTASNITASASLPAGFFTAVTGGYCIPSAGSAVMGFVPTSTGYNTSTISTFISGISGTTAYISWFVIGV